MKTILLRCLFLATIPLICIITIWLVSFGAFELIETLRHPLAVAIDCVFLFCAFMYGASESDPKPNN